MGLLTVSVSLGLALSTRILGASKGKSLLAWHQTLMWTGVSMVALHGVALLLDPTIHFGFGAVLVPGVAPWRPVTVAAGIITAWLMLTLAASFHVRRRIGQKRWRLLHYAGFGAFFLGLWHAVTAGSDLIDLRGAVFAGLLAAPVLWLTFARILMPRSAPRRAPAAPPPSEDIRHGRPARHGRGVMGAHLAHLTFPAMGTTCAVAVTVGPGEVDVARQALDAGVAEVAACERALSRFDSSSDLTALNDGKVGGCLSTGGWSALSRPPWMRA